MTNTLAIWIVVIVVGFFALDHYVLHWDADIIVMRLVTDTVQEIAFWR